MDIGDLFDQLGWLARPLSMLHAAFTIWMLVDASRRGVDWFWYLLIILFQPLGPYVYFLLVRTRGLRGPDVPSWKIFQRRVSLDELRYRAEQTGTAAARRALAEALVEKGLYAEAMPHLEAVLEREPEYCPALYDLARCHLEQGHPELARPLLDKLLAHDGRWNNYAAWHLLIRVHEASNDRAAALLSCREVARRSPTFQHQCLLAERLHTDGESNEAEAVAERLLDEYSYSPGHIRRANRTWAKRAERLLKQLQTG
jgi:hypothetical protein